MPTLRSLAEVGVNNMIYTTHQYNHHMLTLKALGTEVGVSNSDIHDPPVQPSHADSQMPSSPSTATYIFSKIHTQELSFTCELGVDLVLIGNAPLIASLDSPYAHASTFRSFRLGFSIVLDFSWVESLPSSSGKKRP
ncbi:hypothetical protein MRB53_012785 [Persea americana]|uniref:Uncharacterized protein n=1 Tax=Persea americana TaxID=3435 RepID=A0ACC2LZ85_PERAE|nr:hypothetical protein MRB53_012785 [Persea americana]